MLLVDLLQNCVKALLSYELFDIRIKKKTKIISKLMFYISFTMKGRAGP